MWETHCVAYCRFNTHFTRLRVSETSDKSVLKQVENFYCCLFCWFIFHISVFVGELPQLLVSLVFQVLLVGPAHAELYLLHE